MLVQSGTLDLPQIQWNVSQENQDKFKKLNNVNIKQKRKILYPDRKETIDFLKIDTTERDKKILTEKNEATKPLLSREEIRRRYTRIRRSKKIPEKKSGDDQKTKPMWLAANVNSFNANFKRSPCYSFQCLPRIRNKWRIENLCCVSLKLTSICLLFSIFQFMDSILLLWRRLFFSTIIWWRNTSSFLYGQYCFFYSKKYFSYFFDKM